VGENSAVRIDIVTYDHPDAAALIAELQQEYVVRYGEQDGTLVAPEQFAPPLGLFLVGYLDDEPVSCGGWRTHGDGAAELKRMYVSPRFRGRGLARAMLAELERTASAAGHTRIILETGQNQPEALAMYASSGYTPVPSFGHYADHELSVHLGKTIGAELEVR